MTKLLLRMDPMIALLLIAMGLAVLFPAIGDTRAMAIIISNCAIFLLFFLNGLRIQRSEILTGFRHWQFLLPLTLWCFAAMPLAGLGLSKMAQGFLPTLVAVGFIFLGTLPSTVQSATAYTSLAKGNVAASVVAAALLNILGVFITAPLFAWLSGGEGFGMDTGGLQKIILILILPFILGQIAQNWLWDWAQKQQTVIKYADRAAIAIAVYVAFSGAVERDVFALLDGMGWLFLSLFLTLFLIFGFGGAFALAKLLKLDRGDKISFTFAGAHKSTAMGAPLALVLFAPESAGLILVPLLFYHLLQMMVSAPLVSYFSRE